MSELKSKLKSKLRLSVLDQSPVHDDQAESSGVQTTVALAKACDKLGYYRYWLAEHHGTPGYAGPCPEIMISNVAHATENIRVGSGGVMLPHYSAFKVAETFKMLEASHPGRIDVGVGRAPGGDMLVSQALSAPRQTIPSEYYPQQTQDLIGFLNNALPDGHPYQQVVTVPRDVGAPPVWMLGSSDGSAGVAGMLGAGFVLALFIGTHDRSPQIIQQYRDAFQPNIARDKPEAIIAVAAICAETEEEAIRAASSHVYWKVQAFRHGKADSFYSPDEVLEKKQQLSLSDQAYYDETLETMIVGTPEQCREQLEALAEQYQVDELIIVCVTHSFKTRMESYTLLAKQFALSPQSDLTESSGET